MKEEAIAGVLMKKNSNQVVILDENKKVKRVLTIRGNWVYAARCDRPEVEGPIILTEGSQQQNVILILAVGNKCTSGVKTLDRAVVPTHVTEIMKPNDRFTHDRLVSEDELLAILDGEDE